MHDGLFELKCCTRTIIRNRNIIRSPRREEISIDITFYEPEEGVVRTYLQDALEVHEVVAPVLSGFDAFCEFVDGHFAGRITQASPGRANTT